MPQSQEEKPKKWQGKKAPKMNYSQSVLRSMDQTTAHSMDQTTAHPMDQTKKTKSWLTDPRTCQICQVGLPANGIEYRCYKVVKGNTIAQYIRYCGRPDCHEFAHALVDTSATSPKKPIKPKLSFGVDKPIKGPTCSIKLKLPPCVLSKPIKPTKPTRSKSKSPTLDSQIAALVVKYQHSLPVELHQKGVLVTFDGASKKNKLAGAGAALWIDNVLKRIAFCHLPKATNNQAEYTGLILALHLALKCPGVKIITIAGDSKLVINQMTGAFAVKNMGLKRLYQQAKPLAQLFEGDQVEIQYTHVYRRFNACADQLANLGVKSTKFDGLDNLMMKTVG